MTDLNNFVAVGADELGDVVNKGDLVQSLSGHSGCVEYGKTENGKETNLLGFITAANGTPYLVAIKGKLLKGCVKL